MAQIDKQRAMKIVKKLKAILLTSKGAHDKYGVYVNDKLVCSFGIRRSSSKSCGHGHIPTEIFVSPHQAQELADCTMSLAQWVSHITSNGHV
ncbi:hypothetical protein K2Y11_21295 [bacterium]|nr:hypothetical protein [bacterium]